MTILKQLCAVPTAPFVEDRVVAYVRHFVSARRGLKLSRDRTGNLLIELPGRKRKLPRWVYTAHMDHPGMVSRAKSERNILEADFRGWVLADYLKGVKVRFFGADREIRGTIVDVTADKDEGRGARARSVRVRVSRPVEPNLPGMFDVGGPRVKGKLFYCRVCDDLAGAAAALSMLDQLRRNPPASTVAVLLTRAEEEGFIGAMAASMRPRLLRKSDRIIAIETSAEQPYAPQGAGPIIRVGDRTSTFNSALTYFLTQQAEALKKSRKHFVYQRALMPGGTCEATVYDVYGFHAASICVALGNYHNMDRPRNKIAAEYIHIDDWKGMTDLFIRIARAGHEYSGSHTALRQRLEKRFKTLEHLLASRA